MFKSDGKRNLIILLLVTSGLFAVGIWWLVKDQLPSDLTLLLDKDHLRSFIADFGGWAPAVFVFFQALQVVVAPFPGELTGSIAGALFGGFMGTVYATAGLALGGLVAFSIGRLLGKPFLFHLFGEETFSKYAFATNERRNFAILLTFLIPGFPKDILTYLFSFGKVKFVTFFVLSQLGRLPGTVALTYFGSAAIERDWVLAASLFLLSVLIVVVSYFYRKKIESILKGMDY